MKKHIMRIVTALLAAILCAASFMLTSCKDPLQAKIDEMDRAFVSLGNAYVESIKATEAAGVFSDMKDEYSAWKTFVLTAKNENADYLSYSEAEMDEMIEKWNAVTAELRAVYEQYTYETAEDGSLLYPEKAGKAS